MLATDQEIRVVDECNNGIEAIESIHRHRPQLLFLDVQMPGLSGFDVLKRLSPHEIPYVILVTAYDQYAIQAFDVHALDYLLKPLDKTRLARSLQRAKEVIQQKGLADLSARILAMLGEHTSGGISLSNSSATPPKRYTEHIETREGQRIHLIPVRDITWIEAANQYVRLHTGSESYLLTQSLSGLTKQLDPQQFIRIHRSSIVNAAYVKDVLSADHGALAVVLTDGTRLQLSRRRRDALRDILRRRKTR